MSMIYTLPPATTVRQWAEGRLAYHWLFAPILATEKDTVGTNRWFEAAETTSRSPEQMYYWAEPWQRAEESARADILAGRVTVLDGPEGVDRHFTRLTEASQRRRRRGPRAR